MDRKQAIKEIKELNRSSNENLLRLPGDYFHYKKLHIGSIPGNILRACESLISSMENKIECVKFHMSLLLRIEEQILNKFHSNPLDIELQNNLMIYGGNNLLFFLDDIVIHIVSLFDYLGNLIGFCLHGEDKKDMKWKGIISYCESQNREQSECGEEKIRNSSLHPEVLKYQRELMGKLEGYRGNRIHLVKDSAERKVSLDLMYLVDSKIEFGIPRELKTWTKKNVPQADTLVDISIWFVKKSLIGTNEILHKLREEMSKKR